MKVAVNSFAGCTERRRFYQDCNDYLECQNEDCSAKKLFDKPPKKKVKQNLGKEVPIVKCGSCGGEMTYITCIDSTNADKNGRYPRSRRYLDFDYCHSRLLVKYVGTHTCLVSREVPPVDLEVVKKLFGRTIEMLRMPFSKGCRTRPVLLVNRDP